MESIINHQGAFIKKCDFDKSFLSKIKNDLTVVPYSNFGNIIPECYDMYIENTDYLVIPIYYFLKLNLNYDIKFPKKENDYTYNCNIVLRENQVEFYKTAIKEFEKPFGGGILNLVTGFGKSLLSLKIISFYKGKTLILVNKLELIDQWRKEISKFIPDVKVGIIQGTKFIIDNCEIIIGMLQTISINKKFKACDFKWVDLLIIDEIQNISSQVFSRICFKLRPKYAFGLSATIERADKTEKVIKWYIGDILCSNVDGTAKKQETQIYIYKYSGESSHTETLRDGTVAISKMISNIALDPQRNNLLYDIIIKIIKDSNRHILLLSDRNDQLKYLYNKLGENISGLFIGSLKQNERELSKTKQVLLANYKMAAEGFNLPKLNTLIFGTSRSTINQAIGRIFRKKHEITPIIIEIVDEVPVFKGQYYKRRKLYKELIENVLFINKNNIEDQDKYKYQDENKQVINGYLFD
jgi:superfamily II DNA or RNA helicase